MEMLVDQLFVASNKNVSKQTNRMNCINLSFLKWLCKIIALFFPLKLLQQLVRIAAVL